MTAPQKQQAKVSIITAVSTIGISAVIVLWGFPWMMKLVTSQQEFSQNKLVDVIEKSITATEKSTSATQEQTQRINQQTSRMDDLRDSHRELCMKLDKLIEIHTKAAK